MALSEYMNLGYQLGDRIYLPEATEYGGLIEDKETSTYEDSVFLRGYTWRGLLEQKIICPENGKEKLTISGEANEILAVLTEGWFDGLMRVDDADSGIQIQSYEMDGYVDGLEGIDQDAGEDPRGAKTGTLSMNRQEAFRMRSELGGAHRGLFRKYRI
ncbi:MAG: hypothetical protein ACLTM8_10795 [Veillonella parvula]